MVTSARAPARDSPMTDNSAGTAATSWNRTAKPSRIALSNLGESASERTSSRRMRCGESESATGSAGIQSGRSFDFAIDITISRPRSIGSILEQFSGFGCVEDQILLVRAHVDGPVIFEIERER